MVARNALRVRCPATTELFVPQAQVTVPQLESGGYAPRVPHSVMTGTAIAPRRDRGHEVRFAPLDFWQVNCIPQKQHDGYIA